MEADNSIYDKMYLQAKKQGWPGWGGPARIQRIDDGLPDDAPKAGKLIELGCGEGTRSRLHAQQGFEVTGVDVSQVAIDWANEQGSPARAIRYLSADLALPLLTDEHFDVILDGNSLHCMIGTARAGYLENAYRWAKRGGLFVISCRISKGKKADIIYRENAPFRYFAARDELHQEMAQAGFAIESETIHSRELQNHCNMSCRVAAGISV